MDLKACLRAVTLELRRELEGRYDADGRWVAGDLEVRLASLGVRRDRAAVPVGEMGHLAEEDKVGRRAADAFVENRVEAGLGREAAVGELVRECAYSWANRLLALRCMEARGLIDEVILQKAAYGGRSLQHHRLAKKEPERCAGADEGLFAALFDEFGRQARELPAVFNPKAPEVALRPSVPAMKRCVGLLSGTVVAKGQEAATDEVFTGADALGWAYQYWNLEEKDRVFAAAAGKGPDRKKHKIEGADIAPATCFYTDPYMVSFLVQNSLGALWMGMRPDSRLAEGWDYYVRDADRAPAKAKPVREITFLDPACGSGHFLIEAFDVFYAMYVEEGMLKESPAICASIFEHNLHGIDIDERAIQFAALALVMKAKEKAPGFVPTRINLVATNIRLPSDKRHLDDFLSKHPDDAPLKPALYVIFEALAAADELGSLLQVGEPVEKELRLLKAQHASAQSWPAQLVLVPGARAPVQGELPVGVESYEAWKERTLERLRKHFEAEANAPDLGLAFFGEAAEKGLSLVDMLTRRYDVVAANPPYMGSKNMGPNLKRHVEKYFKAGKRDLYAAFILRCRELSASGARVAIVAQQSWMFLRSYAEMRAMDVTKKQLLEQRAEMFDALLERQKSPPVFGGMLRDTTIEIVAHLGRYAFADIGNAAVAPVMFVAQNSTPLPQHRLWACRLSAPRPSDQQASLLQAATVSNTSSIVSRPAQKRFLSIPQSPVSYWLRERFFDLLAEETLDVAAEALQGLSTANNPRFVRFAWEAPPLGWAVLAHERRWAPFEKGGGYGKWYGHHFWVVEWGHDGRRVKQYTIERHGHEGKCVRSDERYFESGWTYSYMASGSLGLRRLEGSVFSDLASGVFFRKSTDGQAALLNCRLSSMIVRSISAKMQLHESYVLRVPLPTRTPDLVATIEPACLQLKRYLVAVDPTERTFVGALPTGGSLHEAHSHCLKIREAVAASLHALEACSEREVFAAYVVEGADLQAILDETGTPAGWFGFVADYNARPSLPGGISVADATIDAARPDVGKQVSVDQLAELKRRLGVLYEAGPRARPVEDDIEPVAESGDDEDDDDAGTSGARVPIPAETFLEELSQKLEIHPISVYWLLRELREKDGVVCLPELRRFVEDHFTVLILRLLGHRWPKQIEAGEPLPPWSDDDGIIPLIEGASEPPLISRLRDRIAEDFGADRVTAIEREFQDIIGKPLTAWITSDFFKRHTSQFKKRPIAWHIESRPVTASKAPLVTGKKRRPRVAATKSAPAFSCLIYYHRLDADLLPKIRTQYIGPMLTRLQVELSGLEKVAQNTVLSSEAEQADRDGRRADLHNKLEELSELDKRLDTLSQTAFASPTLTALLTKEPLDAWTSRDGLAPVPPTHAALLAQESRYDPDINDGVRVNIAPLQKALLLSSDVLAAKDLDKAIADRADWRADERRWCREKKLPRPGWWPILPEEKP